MSTGEPQPRALGQPQLGETRKELVISARTDAGQSRVLAQDLLLSRRRVETKYRPRLTTKLLLGAPLSCAKRACTPRTRSGSTRVAANHLEPLWSPFLPFTAPEQDLPSGRSQWDRPLGLTLRLTLLQKPAPFVTPR